MAVDMFIKLGQIKGDSKDTKHKDWIDVLAWSWGASQSGTAHMGGGAGAGKVSVQDLNFTHYVDAASADLLKAICTGKHIDKGTLVVRKAGGDNALEYIKIEMETIIVTGLHTGGSGGEDRLTENVTLNFEKFKYEYKEQTERGGAGTGHDVKYNIAANKVG
jgi:type VI secretion system secreted protein Hcp